MAELKLTAANEAEMDQLAAQLAAVLSAGDVIFLSGPLGAGKTTLVRGVLRALGYSGIVKSPTYTLLESYDLTDEMTAGFAPRLADVSVHHFDLYRVDDPEELEFMGWRDFFSGENICFVEWAECGVGYLPKADVDIALAYETPGRRLVLSSATKRGDQLLVGLSEKCT